MPWMQLSHRLLQTQALIGKVRPSQNTYDLEAASRKQSSWGYGSSQSEL